MFTGIVEEVGRVESIVRSSNLLTLKIKCKKVLKDLTIGDSIASNGVCLTVKDFGQDFFQADLMKTSLDTSSLGQLKKGSLVNLERALKLNDRLDGHLVSGHVDTKAFIEEIVECENYFLLRIRTDKKFLKYVIDKGSVCIDGISLTVCQVFEDSFSVSIIPHTRQETNLREKSVGDLVNLEFDMVGKYLENFINFKEEKEDISIGFLQKFGYF